MSTIWATFGAGGEALYYGQAEGKSEQAGANLKQAGEKVKDAFNG